MPCHMCFLFHSAVKLYRCNVLSAVQKRLFKQCTRTDKTFRFLYSAHNTGVSAAGVHLTPSSYILRPTCSLTTKAKKLRTHIAKKGKLERRSLFSKVVCGKARERHSSQISPPQRAHRRWRTFFLSPPPSHPPPGT